MRSDSSKVVALFDLDGTLLPWDTQLLFYNDVIKRHGWRRLMMVPFFCCLPMAWLLGDGIMKRLFLAYLWRMPRVRIHQLALAFVEKTISPIFYSELMARLNEHKKNGDFCVLTTASPDIYASVIAERLGFDCCFATDISYGERMGLFPRLPHANNKGKVKVERLKKSGLLGGYDSGGDVIAYSDSSADLPMLQFAKRRVLVNPSKELASFFSPDSCEVLTPNTPWRSRGGKLRGIFLQLLGIWFK